MHCISRFSLTAIRPVDILFCLILLLLSMTVQQGRLGASVNGVELTTDAANYAAMAAAQAHPEAFAKDDAFSDPAVYGVHTTLLVPIISKLAQDGNYGLAYLKLTGVHVFIHYLTFYVLGMALLKKRWQAMLFTLLMGQAYWILWGTYWGAGYLDYTPRTTFELFYPLYICAALCILKRPRWWPLFMACTGLLVYIHSISTLPVAIGFLLGFMLHRPAGSSHLRHWAWLCFSGFCFLAVISPFILKFLRPGVPLSADDVQVLRHILQTRFDIEFTNYWQGIRAFALHHCALPIFPLGLAGAWVMRRWGTEEEKTIAAQFGMWALGVACVAGIFVLDQEMALRLGRHHYEFDLVRVLRFLVFFAICLAFMGINVLLRIVPPRRVWGRRLAGLAWAGLFIGLFIGGQQDQGRTSLLWFWNSLDPARYAQAYAPQLRRAAMIDALKTHTEPGASIFYPTEDQAIRHNAQRSLVYGWKDASIFYYAKDVPKLRRWSDIYHQISSSPTAYIDVARRSGADYVLSNRPQDRALLETLGPVVWAGEGYLLLKLETAPGAGTR